MSVIILAAALVLYPTALGFTPVDLYRLGFQPVVLGPIVFMLFAVSVWFSSWLPAIMLPTGFIAFYFGCLESDNLWDYLIDPVITIYAITLVVIERRRLKQLLL
ncbi:MAG: hypothetical protein HOC70_17145 [Gammaproteobacteria bacterium]|nr:hypothetical protein [Gammaproteobacteria bacterium]